MQKLGKEQIRKSTRTVLAFHLYAKKDTWIDEHMFTLFGDRGSPVKLKLSNLARSVQLVVDKGKWQCVTGSPSVYSKCLEVFQSLDPLLELTEAVKHIKIKVAQSYVTDLLIGFCV